MLRNRTRQTRSDYASSFLHRTSMSPLRKNCDQKALRSEAPLQALAQHHTAARHRGKLWSKGTTQRNLVAVSYTSTPTACYHGSKSFAKILASSSAFSRLKIPDITNKEIHQWGHTHCA
ncbi:hypothetical protein ACFX19_000596 [Malus domestica]